MLRTARYSATPHSNARTHKIPIDVIESLAGVRDQEALDAKRCLFELLIVSASDLPRALPPVMASPSSGGEVRIGKKLLPNYPDEFPPGHYLIVQITPL